MAESPVDILLVEDNENDVELALRALRHSRVDARIGVARDGREALDLFFDGTTPRAGVRPRLVLLDLKLPRVSGIEVLRRLKSDATTRSIPVVVLTTSAEPSDLRECYALGVNSYLQKPIAFDRFIDVVRSLGLYWLEMNQVPQEDRRG